ncbi:MAG: insulinase family protein [Clostridia bacterium]|nr:insulinase family protein [Clostridia bacterium]
MSENQIIQKTNEFGETYFYTKHKSGLDIYVIPKDFATNYAVFATRYGAIDNCFKTEDEENFHEVPDGIAHYLEHKMFENEDGTDTFSRFAKYGASANAYTSATMTAYLFSCTNHLKENLEILLDYVSKPYFTSENVEKERGIIAQEIKMYEDNPGSAIYYNLLQAMYEKHQTRVDVAGTVESIAKITPELLYDCYNTFYNFANMTLCVSGRTDMQTVLSIADRILPEREPKTVCRHYHEEKPEVFQPRVTKKFEISRPMFLLGVKDMDISEDAEIRMKKRVAMSILTDMLFGPTSAFAIDVYESGLVNGFEASYDHSFDSSRIFLEGETDAPETFYTNFLAYLDEIREKGLCEEDFNRIKRATYASYIKVFDSTKLAREFTHMIHDACDPFAFGEAIKNASFGEVKTLFGKLFKEEYYAMSVVMPLDAEEDGKDDENE